MKMIATATLIVTFVIFMNLGLFDSRNDSISGLGRTPYTTFGHVHMAKTAGTTLNGQLAAHFERVCGHKGYSFDFAHAIQRFTNNQLKDSYSSEWPGYSRLRVPDDVMDEIAFEDCDWISIERHAIFWNQFASWPFPLELHLPCRDPLDHLMSQCNHKGIVFECADKNMEEQIKSCIVEELTRFSMDLANTTNIDLKCYNYNQTFPNYIQYMATKLQRKRIESEYVFRATNKDRANEQECIWADKELQLAIHEYLLSNYDYYSFCDTCIGSAIELPLRKI